MVHYMMDEIVAAADIVAVEAMSMMKLLYEEAEATLDFLMEAAAWMESLLRRATALVVEF